jgi:hypothetical protein
VLGNDRGTGNFELAVTEKSNGFANKAVFCNRATVCDEDQLLLEASLPETVGDGEMVDSLLAHADGRYIGNRRDCVVLSRCY